MITYATPDTCTKAHTRTRAYTQNTHKRMHTHTHTQTYMHTHKPPQLLPSLLRWVSLGLEGKPWAACSVCLQVLSQKPSCAAEGRCALERRPASGSVWVHKDRRRGRHCYNLGARAGAPFCKGASAITCCNQNWRCSFSP